MGIEVKDLENMARKPFSIKEKLEDVALAQKAPERFGLNREDIKAAIADLDTTVEVSVTKSRTELVEYLRELYDGLARKYSFDSMAHMMAAAHTELIARAVHNPERFGKESLPALRDVAKLLYPAERATVTKRLPAGDRREDVLQRLSSRLRELPPSTTPEEAA